MELKPCPFCGENDPEIEHIEGTILHPAYFVKCSHCGAQAPGSDKGDHVALWNKRAAVSDASIVTANMVRAARNAYDKAKFPELNKWKQAIYAALASAPPTSD